MNESKRKDRVVACQTILTAKATAEVAEEVSQELSEEDPVNIEEGFVSLVSRAETLRFPLEEPQSQFQSRPRPPRQRRTKS